MFALAYVALRLAGVRVALAWATLTVGVVVLVFNLDYPLGGLLQHGAFRFGLPMIIVAAAAGEARATGRGVTILRIVEVVALGIASIWALEAFLYSIGALAGLTAFRAAMAPSGRLRVAGRVLLEALIACFVVHLVFAVTTLIASGDLPDWGNYLTTLREFLTGKVGELTYDFSPWSPALAVGAIYAASVLGIAAVVRSEPEIATAGRGTLLVLSATTGYGVALFSYFVNRSADHILPYVSLPALMVVALWLELLLREPRFSRPGRGLALGATSLAAALLVAVAWSDAGLRFSQSALAYAAPGGRSLPDAIDRLVHLPPLAPGTADATRLLDTYMPDEHESVVLTSADTSVETLMRTHRASEIPLSDPWEDSLVPRLHEAEVTSAVAELQPGRRILIDSAARDALRTGQESSASLVPTGITSLQLLALREIDRRFALKTIARSPSGIEVVELRPRVD
jgi:hypothetical protein